MKDKIHGGDVYRHKNALDFSANMNPLGTPEAVIRAAAESLRRVRSTRANRPVPVVSRPSVHRDTTTWSARRRIWVSTASS